MKDKKDIFIIILIVVILGGGIYLYLNNNVVKQGFVDNGQYSEEKDNTNNNQEYNIAEKQDDNTVACTADAMQCADGSFVGRTGSNCEFVCPNNIQEGWNKYSNTEYGFTLEYPTIWSVLEDKVSPLGGFYYVAFGIDTNKPLATLRIYKNEEYIHNPKGDLWLDSTLGGIVAKEKIEEGQKEIEYYMIVAGKGIYSYELASTVFDDNVELVKTVAESFIFTDQP